LSVRANFIASGAHSGSCLRRLFWRTFWIVPAALVFLYFGSCLRRLFSCILDRVCGACFLVFWIVPAALVFLYFDQGWGKDLTDSLIMQHKQRNRECVKPTEGSARNATECTKKANRISFVLSEETKLVDEAFEVLFDSLMET
jgi:hypothetical protein